MVEGAFGAPTWATLGVPVEDGVNPSEGAAGVGVAGAESNHAGEAEEGGQVGEDAIAGEKDRTGCEGGEQFLEGKDAGVVVGAGPEGRGELVGGLFILRAGQDDQLGLMLILETGGGGGEGIVGQLVGGPEF